MTYAERYLKSFGDNLTEKQIKIIKDSFGYQRAIGADAVENFKKELIESLGIPKICKWLNKLLGG